MIDTHTHILYGIDDGSRSLEESISMLRNLSALGFTKIIATPHYIENSEFIAGNKQKKALLKELKEKINEENIPLELYLGNEIFIQDNIIEKIYNQEIYTLNNTSFMLIELPLLTKFDFTEDLFFELRKKGVQIVLAHPERYVMFQQNLKLVNSFIEMGCLLQGNIDCLSGKYGKEAKKTFIKLLEKRKYFVLASDIHHAKTGYFERFAKLKKEVIKLTSEQYFNDLMINNPEKILNDEIVID